MLTWKAHDRPVYDLAFTPDGRLITSADDATRLWDTASETQIREWTDGYALTLAVSPDGRMAAGAGSGQALLWPIDGGRTLSLVRGVYEGQFVAFRPNGIELVGRGSSDNPLRRWAVPTGTELIGQWPPFDYSDCIAGPLAFHPSGTTLATGGFMLADLGPRLDKAVVFRNADTGEQLARLCPSRSTSPPSRLAFSPDGKLLAGIYGPSLILWDVASRVEVVRHQPSRKLFNGLAFTPDGTRLLTASNDESIRVWVAATWAETTAYAWKVGKLGCVAVSADGTLAAAGGSTGKVVVWDLD
jgi:WD40 repeat protein